MSTRTSPTPALAARGIKRECANEDCGRRFYDLNALPKPCPYCGTMFLTPVAKPVDPNAYRPAKPKVYKLQKDTPLPDEPLANADLPVIDAEEESIEDGADEIPEIEEEEDDDVIATGTSERGDA